MRGKTGAVFEHLQNKGSITSMEAFEMYGATRLSAIIFNLRGKGYDIVTIPIKAKTRFGDTVTFAKYVLKEDDE